MTRETPKTVKVEAFKLWLQGHSYREIRDKLGVSVGSINEIITNIRAGAPDLDGLRKLNTILRREGSTVHDAVRGGLLMDRLGQLGVGLDKVSGFVEFSEKIASEKGTGSEALVDSALRLLDLGRRTGKAYKEILEEYEKKLSELAMLNDERPRLEREVQGIKQELVRTVESVSSKSQELKGLMSTKERLEKLGLEKVDQLSLFIEDYEKLGFSAEEVQRLSGWKVSLALMGIKSEELDDYIKRHGPLNKQLRELGEEVAGEKNRLERVARQYRYFSTQVAIASALTGFLTSRMISIACPQCGRPVPLRIPTFWELDDAVRRGLACQAGCLNCGFVNHVAPRDVFTNVGWAILQAEADAQFQPTVPS
jgi:hypothetical protein